MNMKMISILTAAVISVSIMTAVAPSVYADSKSKTSASDSAQKKKEDEAMKKALTLVKSRITIPEELKDFSYSTSINKGVRIFYFTWKGDNKTLNVYTYGDMIVNYELYDYSFNNRNTYSFAPFTEEKYKEMALKWLKKVNPEVASQIDWKSFHVQLSDNNKVYIEFARKAYDIAVKYNANNGEIALDKKTGEVLSFYCDWWQDAKFSDPEGILTQDEIKAQYKKDIPIKPYYVFEHSKTDYSKIEKVNVVYRPIGSELYDAYTGKTTPMYDDFVKYMNTDYYEDDSIDAGEGIDEIIEEEMAEITFSDEEIKAMQELGAKLSADEVRKILEKDKYLNLTGKYKLRSANYNRNEKTWQLSYSINNKEVYANMYVLCSAETGKIINFSKTYNDYTKKDRTSIDVKQINKTANDALKYYMGTKVYGQYIASNENNNPCLTTKDYTESSRQLTYARYMNNIQVSEDNAYITVNSDNEVMAFNYNYHDIDFGDGKILSKDAAYKKFFEQKDFELYYDGFTDLNSKPHTYLCYKPDSNWNLNAVTGELCYGDGSAITKPADRYSYSDIAESPYRAEIEKLAQYGVMLESNNGKFDPKSPITVLQFENLVSQVNNFGEVADEEIIEVIETDENGNERAVQQAPQKLTRAMMARIFVRYSGLNSDLMEKYPSIFRSPFKDVRSDSPDVGYIAAANAIGAVFADKDGTFGPDMLVSREYAIHVIYKYIENSSKKKS